MYELQGLVTVSKTLLVAFHKAPIPIYPALSYLVELVEAEIEVLSKLNPLPLIK
jgi:hypothetical protein